MSLAIVLSLSLLAIFLVFGAAFAWVIRLASEEKAPSEPLDDPEFG